MAAWLTVTLRLQSSSLSGSDVSRLASVAPTEVFEKDEPVARGSSVLRDNTIWMLKADDTDVDGFADRVRSLMGEVSTDVAIAVEAGALDASVFVGVFMADGQTGLWVDWSIEKLLAKYRCDLVFDIYPPDGNDD